MQYCRRVARIMLGDPKAKASLQAFRCRSVVPWSEMRRDTQNATGYATSGAVPRDTEEGNNTDDVIDHILMEEYVHHKTVDAMHSEAATTAVLSELLDLLSTYTTNKKWVGDNSDSIPHGLFRSNNYIKHMPTADANTMQAALESHPPTQPTGAQQSSFMNTTHPNFLNLSDSDVLDDMGNELLKETLINTQDRILYEKDPQHRKKPNSLRVLIQGGAGVGKSTWAETLIERAPVGCAKATAFTGSATARLPCGAQTLNTLLCIPSYDQEASMQKKNAANMPNLDSASVLKVRERLAGLHLLLIDEISL